jgi:hypothetical protein
MLPAESRYSFRALTTGVDANSFSSTGYVTGFLDFVEIRTVGGPSSAVQWVLRGGP